MVGVEEQEAVIFPAIMAEKVTAIPAVPHCLTLLIFVCMAVMAAVCSLCSPHRKVSLTEFLWWLCKGWSARMLSCRVFSKQALCQFYSKSLEVMDRMVSRKVFVYNVAIGYTNVK